MQEVKNRSQMDATYMWRLEDIFESNEKWEETFKLAEEKSEGTKALAGTLGSAKGLLDAVRAIVEASMLMDNLFTYARMRRDEDNDNSLYQGMTDRAMALYVKFGTNTAFFLSLIHI